MRQFWLNDDEVWFWNSMRSLTRTQQEVLYMLVRQMSQNKLPTLILQGKILPIDLRSVTRREPRKQEQNGTVRPKRKSESKKQ